MKLLKKIRCLIIFFILALLISGLTAFPLESELSWLVNHSDKFPLALSKWLHNCYFAMADTNNRYPMLAYGFDWLAFAHIVIALAFAGPLIDPVKNKWIIDWAILACIAVIPLATIAGPVRHIPVFHIIIDCSFGIIGLIPLLICRRLIRKLELGQGDGE